MEDMCKEDGQIVSSLTFETPPKRKRVMLSLVDRAKALGWIKAHEANSALSPIPYVIRRIGEDTSVEINENHFKSLLQLAGIKRGQKPAEPHPVDEMAETDPLVASADRSRLKQWWSAMKSRFSR